MACQTTCSSYFRVGTPRSPEVEQLCMEGPQPPHVGFGARPAPLWLLLSTNHSSRRAQAHRPRAAPKYAEPPLLAPNTKQYIAALVSVKEYKSQCRSFNSDYNEAGPPRLPILYKKCCYVQECINSTVTGISFSSLETASVLVSGQGPSYRWGLSVREKDGTPRI